MDSSLSLAHRAGAQGLAPSRLVYVALLSGFLILVIMAVATDRRAVGAAAAIAIGGTIGLDAPVGGPVTGASMDPARSLGPALVASHWQDFWICVVGPVVGATVGGLAYQAARRASPPTSTVEGGREPDGSGPVRLPA